MESRISTEKRPVMAPLRIFRLATMDRLKLMALDAEDLAVISAQVQDAVTKPDAIDYRPREKRFTLVINRFAWDAGGQDVRGPKKQLRTTPGGSVVRAGAGVRTIGMRRDDDDQVLSLLADPFHRNRCAGGH
jgi:hypothetical protein